jgi:hypothetical protein
MAHQGFRIDLRDHGSGRWIAVFYRGGGGQQPIEPAGTAQEASPWRAVQRAAWAALMRNDLILRARRTAIAVRRR